MQGRDETRVPRFVGQSVPRREDRRLLLGRGRFIADMTLPGMLHAAFVRSDVAHGRIRSIATQRALAAPGVVAVFTGADIAPHLAPIVGMQNRPPKAWRDAVEHELAIPDQPILATDKVTYVGCVINGTCVPLSRTPLRAPPRRSIALAVHGGPTGHLWNP